MHERRPCYFAIFVDYFHMKLHLTLQMRSSFIISVLLIFLTGCIERYYPGEEEIQTGTLVVVAHLNNLPGVQSVYLTRSTTLELPKVDPVSGYYVVIERADGTIRELEESQPGEYSSFLDEEFLGKGNEYRLIFIDQNLKKRIPHPILIRSIFPERIAQVPIRS